MPCCWPQVLFTPYEEQRLVSCSTDNIRFHRERDGQIRTCSLANLQSVPKTAFLCIAFEAAYPTRSIVCHAVALTTALTTVGENWKGGMVIGMYRGTESPPPPPGMKKLIASTTQFVIAVTVQQRSNICKKGLEEAHTGVRKRPPKQEEPQREGDRTKKSSQGMQAQ